MTEATRLQPTRGENQFGLGMLFEQVSLCAVAAALSPWIGPVRAALLMGLSLALAARRGMLALGLLFLASSLPGLGQDLSSTAWESSRELGALAAGATLVVWHGIRRAAWSGQTTVE